MSFADLKRELAKSGARSCIDLRGQPDIVPTNIQAAQAGGFRKMKQNEGMSGKPLWKIQMEAQALREQALEAAKAREAEKIAPPGGEGWIEQNDDVLVHEATKLHFQVSTRRYFRFNDAGGWRLVECDPDHTYETSSVGYAGDGVASRQATAVPETRHVLVPDLVKAGVALKMNIEHMDRPTSLFAAYRGDGASATASDFCAKLLHTKLLLRFASYMGKWDPGRISAALQAAVEELAEEATNSHKELPQGSVSFVACVMCGSVVHVVSCGGAQAVLARQRRGGLYSVEALTQLDLEQSSSCGVVGPRTQVLCSEVAGGETIVLATSPMVVGSVEGALKAFGTRPRAIARGVLQQMETRPAGVVAVHVYQVLPSATVAEPQAKKPRLDDKAGKIRCRHIVLKHIGCKPAVDPLRRKPVTRTMEEAELARGSRSHGDGGGGA